MREIWKIKCVCCGKENQFSDAKDIAQSRWKILAWDVKSGEPICYCEKCDYNVIKNPNKK